MKGIIVIAATLFITGSASAQSKEKQQTSRDIATAQADVPVAAVRLQAAGNTHPNTVGVSAVAAPLQAPVSLPAQPIGIQDRNRELRPGQSDKDADMRSKK